MDYYKAKPIVLPCFQHNASLHDLSKKCKSIINMNKIKQNNNLLIIDSSWGEIKSEAGDWIVVQDIDDFYSIKDSIFKETYEKTDDNTSYNYQKKNSMTIKGIMYDNNIDEFKKHSVFGEKCNSGDIKFIKNANNINIYVNTKEGYLEYPSSTFIAIGVENEIWGIKNEILNKKYIKIKNSI